MFASPTGAALCQMCMGTSAQHDVNCTTQAPPAIPPCDGTRMCGAEMHRGLCRRLDRPPTPRNEVSRDGKTWHVRDEGVSYGDVRFLRQDGVLVAVRNCRDVITRSGEHGFDFQRRLVELEAEEDAPIVTRPEYREPSLMTTYVEKRDAGIATLTLPEARPRFVSSVGDYDLLADP